MAWAGDSPGMLITWEDDDLDSVTIVGRTTNHKVEAQARLLSLM